MEVKVNKKLSHPIEIISCGTSSAITIEDAKAAMEALAKAITYAEREPSEFEKKLSETMLLWHDDGVTPEPEWIEERAKELIGVAKMQLGIEDFRAKEEYTRARVDGVKEGIEIGKKIRWKPDDEDFRALLAAIGFIRCHKKHLDKDYPVLQYLEHLALELDKVEKGEL